MAWRWPWQKPAAPIAPDVTHGADGTVTTTYTMTLSQDNMRPVRTEVVEAIDDTLGRYGEVLHAMDPSRIVSFDHGGPPVWSVGMVRVEGDWLFVTYGMSHLLSPEPRREGLDYEFSLRVPGADEPPVWGPALLRHLARYVLRTGAELRLHDTMPCGWALTRVPFPPEHHAALPDTTLTAIVVASDPLIPSIDTPHGRIAVRRFVGLDPTESALIETWSSAAFLEELIRVQPSLTTDPNRASVLLDPAFRSRAEARARAEGGSIGMLFVEGGWTPNGDGAVIQLPAGDQAEQVRRVLDARIPYGRSLVLQVAPPGGSVAIVPSDEAFSIDVTDAGMLVVSGSLTHPGMAGIVDAIRANTTGTQIRLG